MASQIAKINQSLTTAEEMRNQTKLIMQPYVNWEGYLTPAPLSIAIMGELVFISSQTDFSINKNPPKGGYQYIKYPESFRACLMQVCNSGWWAFNEAHKNMDQIRLHTLTVPDYMKSSVKILFQGDDEVVKNFLPHQLENIRVIADDCLTLASATEKGFSDVINIIQELLEACVNAKHVYGEELDEIKKKLEENKMRKESSEEALKRSEKAVKALEEQLNEAHESYKSAMDSLPSGWEMIGMDFVSSLTECTTNLITGLASTLSNPVSKMSNVSKVITQIVSHTKGQDKTSDGIDEINIYSKSAEILKCAELIQQFVQEENIQWTELYDQKNKCPKSKFALDQLKRINKSLEKSPQCEAKNYAQMICEQGINICNQLTKYSPDRKCEEAKTKELIEEFRKLIESARAFDSKSKAVTHSPAMVPKPPMMNKEGSKSEMQTASQRAADNARFRIEQSRAQLDKTRVMHEKSVENMEKNHKELTEILISMRNCEAKEIDFNTTIKMLVKGMDAMGRVKEQWEKMVRFFQMVSNIVKTSLTVSLKRFVSIPECTPSLSYNGKLFAKDQLYNQAFQATNIANLVHMISGTYTEVSDKHLMDRISSLGKLMVMDKEKPEFRQQRLQLQNGCDAAQKAILQLVQNNKAEFERKTHSRLEKIDKELLAILPSAAPEEMKSIQAAVKSGFTEEEEGDYI
ncbi:uncharacterized protein LOC143517759 isoform X1 [Brachyhypopomus gauderio]|uniref:uncharacterized protein LOC143517759 isoform X1 n=1 Tax=Brachyhypopomus gauderio TaxID=698409 RepID=UPI004040EDB4